MYIYRITPVAAQHIEHEIKYSATYWGKNHAKFYEKGLYQELRTIAQNPYIRPMHPDLDNEKRVHRYRGNYIIYRIKETDNMIDILAFPSIHQEFSTP
jgi:plasmid stabilization system protein ParE